MSRVRVRARIRVLVVDDVPHVRRDLSTLLALSEGIDVVGEAGDGREAVRQAELLRPDVVLMDLEMPEHDGYAATRDLKARHPASRVIALTVYGDDASRYRAFQAGVDAFVEKGATLAVLLQALRQCASVA